MDSYRLTLAVIAAIIRETQGGVDIEEALKEANEYLLAASVFSSQKSQP